MLSDELVANGAPGSGCDISCLLPVIRTAQRFSLSPEFASVADALSTDYTGLVRAFPHCRMPFAQTWIELAHADRPTFYNAQLQAPRFQVKPGRIGYLLTATRPDLSAWKTHLFWSTDKGCSCPALAMEFDMSGSYKCGKLPTKEEMKRHVKASMVLEDVDSHPGWVHANDTVKMAMLTHTNPVIPDYGYPMPDGIPLNQIEDFYRVIADLSRSDWAGEPAYLLAVVALLNARNAVETIPIDYRKLNRARVMRGKPPLFEYKLLKIARRQQRRYANGPGNEHASARGHFVMGHWKVRRTGIFFWHPHKRGDFSKGRIEKDYELT